MKCPESPAWLVPMASDVVFVAMDQGSNRQAVSPVPRVQHFASGFPLNIASQSVLSMRDAPEWRSYRHMPSLYTEDSPTITGTSPAGIGTEPWR
jgi:hypothetical protein